MSFGETLRRVARYEIQRELGRGGMAVVYLARQPDLDRLVALKELAVVHDPAFAERFLRESQVIGSLSHPNIVTVHEYFEHEGTPYIAMEYIDRGSLRPYIGTLSLAQIGGVFEGLYAGLAHAEGRGIVHRDLKPENIMITGEGRIKIADFGIAKALGQATGRYLTATGTTVGTPAYMAPEQAMAQDIGPWTDLYATGVMAYELLIGRVPFEGGDTPLAILLKHVNEPIPAPRELKPDLDPDLARWLERLLEKDPADRARRAREAWEELEEILIKIVGPKWRREARLVRETARTRTPDPLTPAPFHEESAVIGDEETETGEFKTFLAGGAALGASAPEAPAVESEPSETPTAPSEAPVGEREETSAERAEDKDRTAGGAAAAAAAATGGEVASGATSKTPEPQGEPPPSPETESVGVETDAGFETFMPRRPSEAEESAATAAAPDAAVVSDAEEATEEDAPAEPTDAPPEPAHFTTYQPRQAARVAKPQQPPPPETKGATAAEAAATPPPETSVPTVPPTSRPQETSYDWPAAGGWERLRERKILLLGIAAVVLVAIIAVVGVLVVGGGSDETSQPAEPAQTEASTDARSGAAEEPATGPAPAEPVTEEPGGEPVVGGALVLQPEERVSTSAAVGAVSLAIPSGRLVKIDPETLEPSGSVTDAATPRAVVETEAVLYVANDDSVTGYDAQTLEPLGIAPFSTAEEEIASGRIPHLAAHSDGSVAAVRSTGEDAGELCRTGEEIAFTSCVKLDFAPAGVGIASDGSIFVADTAADAVVPFREELDSLIASEPIPVSPGPNGTLIELLGDLYVATETGVDRIDLASGESEAIPLPEPPSSIAISISSGRLLAALPGAGEIAVVDVTAPGAEPTTSSVGTRPVAVSTSANGDVYIVDTADASVSRFDPTSGEVTDSRPLNVLEAPDVEPLIGEQVRFDDGEVRVRGTVVFSGGKFPGSAVKVVDANLQDGESRVEVWQGGITSQINGAQRSGGLEIDVREDLGRLVILVTADSGAFTALNVGRAGSGQALVLTAVKPPPPEPTPAPVEPSPVSPVPTPVPVEPCVENPTLPECFE